MSGKADFTPEEWQTISEAPVSAGLLVMTAQRGGVFRESLALAKAYNEARQQHGQSQLLDEIVSAKPARDHTRYHSPKELQDATLAHLRDAVSALQPKAAPDELSSYKQFVSTVAQRVAEAHREHGVAVSPAEQAALDEITATLGATAG
jgi:response regulator of citrate/malate metabolism